MLTENDYYWQVDGLAKDGPPAPHIANGWLSKFDETIKDDAKLFSRYTDDILQSIKSLSINQKLNEINELHLSLKFTIKHESNNSIPFLGMKIISFKQ